MFQIWKSNSCSDSSYHWCNRNSGLFHSSNDIAAIGKLERHMHKASHHRNNKDHASQSLLLLLVRATYIMVLLLAFIPFAVNHTFNATPPESLQQHPLFCTTNYTDRTFFVWRLTLARPPHTGHSTILLRSEIPSGICASPALWQQVLRSEIPSGMCAKLRTVAASNNRDHARNLSFRTLVVAFNRSHVNICRATTSQSLLLLLARATHIMVLFFTHIPFVVNHTIYATPPERLQHKQQ